jgi:hypothetical protein
MASIRQIYDLYQNVIKLWNKMKKETHFSYDVDKDRRTILQRFVTKTKSNKHRLRSDEMFWNRLDDNIADVNISDFPDTIVNDRSTYTFEGDPVSFKLKDDISKAKHELVKTIIAFNSDKPVTEQIKYKEDIVRMVEETTVVIFILCHGYYKVNDDLTINEIPAPQGRDVEIVKTAPFGFEAITDYNYSSRYPEDTKSKRYSSDIIYRKLLNAYTSVLENVSHISSREQYTGRSIYKYMQSDPSFHSRFGPSEKSSIHVGFEYSELPFLNKSYKLDRLPSKGGFERGEIAHGIIMMFKDKGRFIVINLNKFNDLEMLEQYKYINKLKMWNFY